MGLCLILPFLKGCPKTQQQHSHIPNFVLIFHHTNETQNYSMHFNNIQNIFNKLQQISEVLKKH